MRSKKQTGHSLFQIGIQYTVCWMWKTSIALRICCGILEGIKTGLKEIPKEVEAFCNALAPLLAESMHLSANRELSDECYYKKAAELKKSILEIVEADAQDGGIQAYQHIWRSKKESLFKWTEDQKKILF